MQEDSFAKRLSDAFGLPRAPALHAQDQGDRGLVAVELRSDVPNPGMRDPLREDDAWLLCLHLADTDRIESWEDGRSLGPHAVKAGSCTLHDLRRGAVIRLDTPFHLLAFRLSATIDGALAIAPAAARGGDAGIIDDKVLDNLGRSLLPFLDGSIGRNQRCIDHALQAIAAHVRAAQGGAEPGRMPRRGGLAPWQQRRAQDLLRTHLCEGISLETVAQACSLSSSGFLRAFRQSVGIPPHQWLLRCRIDRAAELMRDRRLSLSEIAVSSGFFDQSHFTRAFSRRMGTSPGAWRKAATATA